MSSGLRTFEDVAVHFPGLVELEPEAVGSFVLSCAQDFPYDLWGNEAGDRWKDRREFWQEEVAELLGDIENWQQAADRDEQIPLDEFAGAAVHEAVIGAATKQLIDELPDLSADEGFDRMTAYLRKWEFEQQVKLAPSPLFPEGRAITKPLEAIINPEDRTFKETPGLTRHGLYKTNALHDDLTEYLRSGHEITRLKERLAVVLDGIEGVASPEKVQKLREQYGAKAANLLVFQEALNSIYSSFSDEEREGHLEEISVPPFEAVGVDMYEAWRSGSSKFEEMLETVRQQALDLATETEGGLVAVRSSAVFSEDNAEHTGAGIYKTALADPSDPQAFSEAVRAVYESVDSPLAVTYRNDHGISREQMGLVVQAYVERNEAYTSIEKYGFVNSQTSHEKVIEVHTPAGVLLFDRPAVQSDLLIDWSVRDANKYLHSLPDHHGELSGRGHQVSAAVHSAVLAERVFGGSIQIEFTGDSIVQVRPLPVAQLEQSGGEVAFLDDGKEIIRTKSIGKGDVTYNQLLLDEDNSQDEGFIVFMSEYGFSENNRGTSALPAKGAVIILGYSDSGHIQTLCQERGLLCFYPDKKSDFLDGFAAYLDEHQSDDEEVLKALRLRFIADGYEGRIYPAVDEEK